MTHRWTHLRCEGSKGSEGSACLRQAGSKGGGIALRAMSMKSALRAYLAVSYSVISILLIGSLRSPPPIRLRPWTHLRCEGSKDSEGSKGSEGDGIALWAMSIKSALRDLLSVSYDMISILLLSRCAAPPYPAAPDFLHGKACHTICKEP